MSQFLDKSKSIAKNTLVYYFRMQILMVAS